MRSLRVGEDVSAPSASSCVGDSHAERFGARAPSPSTVARTVAAAVERDRRCRRASSSSPVDRSRTRRSASGIRRRARRPPRVRRRAPRDALASSIALISSARSCIALANLDGDDALARRRHADLDRQQRRDAMRRAPDGAGRPRRGPAHRSRRRRACAAACRDCRERAGTWPPGNSRVSCAMRRTLLVPMRGARPSVSRTSIDQLDALAPGRQHDRVARILARQHAADRRARPAAPPACPCCCARRGRSRRRAARPRSPSRTAACRRSPRAALRPAGRRTS